LNKPRKILIIIQRSNGDVFLSIGLIKSIFRFFNSPEIDLLINDDTLQVASLLPHIKKIITFSYNKKNNNQWLQEIEIFKKLFRKYDLSINLTSSDRSVLYTLLAGKKTISVVENDSKKSWWKKLFLTKFYLYDSSQHILKQNLSPLALLGIDQNFTQYKVNINQKTIEDVKAKLTKKDIKNFIIFHPSAQYGYKVFPKESRDILLKLLNKLGVPIIVSGSNGLIDTEIKLNLPSLENIFDFIGETSLEEYFALSHLSIAYIGMDTLNMHIAASQNKRIFAIFGPTNLKMWSPWSNELKTSATLDTPVQTYSNITIFQADMPCVACGLAGCDNKHGKSECLYMIKPITIFNEIENWYKKFNNKKNEKL
jgi:heptosyltransferase-3